MHSVFISSELKQKQIDFILNTIKSVNGQVVNKINQADILITITTPNNKKLEKPFAISYICYESMINMKINPFSFDYKTPYLFNLWLYEKSIKFYRIDKNRAKQYTNLVYSMGGIVVDDNANFIITDEKNLDETENNDIKLIHASWLLALQFSPNYLSPNKYYINVKLNYDDSFFEFSYHLFKDHPHWGYSDLKKNLEPKYEFLKNETDENFKDNCQSAFNKITSILKLGEKNSLFKTQKLNEKDFHLMLQNSKGYKNEMKLTPLSGYFSEVHGQWSETETENLLTVLKQGYLTKAILNEKGEIHWPSVAKYVVYRTGESCRNRYNYLKSINDVRLKNLFDGKPEEKICSYMSNDYFYKSLIPEEEEILFQQIADHLKNNELVTINFIKELALKIFNSPLNIATKSFILYKYKKKENPLDENGQIDIEKYGDEFDDFLETADREPQKLIDDYLNDFQASRTWIFNFMMRHKLVFKKAHYKRRGQVSSFQIERYLNEVAIAIDKYGPQKVINMDETSVRTQNFASKIISLKGKDDALVEKNDLKDKEATTFIGAISYDPEQDIPLGIVAKGVSQQCERKFSIHKNDNEFISHSKSGWTTTEVIIKYLKWLKKKMNNQNFALVLDVYKSHINEKVKEEAKKLGIQLIFVPASGTAEYQPLDISIFGIAKKKLVADEEKDPININKKRHENVTKNMENIFHNLTDQSKKAAWNIPRLKELLISDNDESDSSEWKPDEHE